MFSRTESCATERRNCIVHSGKVHIFWEGHKICKQLYLVLLSLKAVGQEFAKVLTSLAQFAQTVKGQNNFWNGMFFLLDPGGVSENSTWKK